MQGAFIHPRLKAQLFTIFTSLGSVTDLASCVVAHDFKLFSGRERSFCKTSEQDLLRAFCAHLWQIEDKHLVGNNHVSQVALRQQLGSLQQENVLAILKRTTLNVLQNRWRRVRPLLKMKRPA